VENIDGLGALADQRGVDTSRCIEDRLDGGDETADVGTPHPGQQQADPDDDRQKPPWVDEDAGQPFSRWLP
jgi:hypothetical protein